MEKGFLIMLSVSYCNQKGVIQMISILVKILSILNKMFSIFTENLRII
jgi:hypothetical protein